MRVLLLAMPDASRLVDCFVRMPNLAIVSLAGSLDGHEVHALDLVTMRPRVLDGLERALRELQPEVVGLSAMTFQFATALDVARLVRATLPGATIVAGGYHVTLMAEELARGAEAPIDAFIRGEGEATFREVVDALGSPGRDLSSIAGLSYRHDGAWRHNPPRSLADLARLPLPRREARLHDGFHVLGLPVDVIETSRGCPLTCTFCSIRGMYGPSFRRFPIERVIADLRAVRGRGARAVLWVDDNITCHPDHLRAVCRAVVAAGLNDLFHIVQVSVAGLQRHPDLVPELARAGVRLAALGLEAMDDATLGSLRKRGGPEANKVVTAMLRRHRIAILAGCMFGFPDDTRAAVVARYRAIERLRPEIIFAQFVTPYPGTALREELLALGLVENRDDFSKYDGFSCNVRTRHLTSAQLHRTLKLLAFLANFDPLQIASNRFLRRWPLRIAAMTIRVAAMLLDDLVARVPRFTPRRTPLPSPSGRAGV